MARAPHAPDEGGDSKAKELREWFAYADTEWADIRREAATDMKYVSGNPWDPRERAQREAKKRPVLTFDELGQYINQVVNEVRANPVAVKFSPVGQGASEQSAEWYANKMREVEYRSNAQVHYTTAFQNAVERSYGFVRVTTRYEHDRSINQEVWIEGFPNPDLVTPDPDAAMPDLSDQRICMTRQAYSYEGFRRRWPRATFASFTPDAQRQAAQWFGANQVFVAEAWEIEERLRTLHLCQIDGEPLPQGLFEDEVEALRQQGRQVVSLRTREVPQPTVWQRLTNGLEILEAHTWAGRYIPIIGCMGKVLYLPEGGDGAQGSKKHLASMVRLARDPQMLYCYYRTTEAEIVGMVPKFPWFVYEGQLAPDQLVALRRSNKEPISVVQVKATFPGAPAGQVMPPPQRNPWEPPIAALEVGAESARRAIQAAMGWTPLPTNAQRLNDKSGVALKKIEQAGQRGSFHFVDNYHGMLRQVGIVCEDLFDKVYDTPREVGVRLPNERSQATIINTPSNPQSISTRGSHLVTVSTGVAYDSQREMASDFADALLQSPMAPRIADLAVKLKGLGPIGDEIATRLVPPEFAHEGEEDGAIDPARVQQQAAMAVQRLQQVEALAQQMKQALDTDREKQKAQVAIELIKANLAIRLERMRSAAKIETARITSQADADTLAAEASEERIALALDHAHAASEAQLERAHDVILQQLGGQPAAAAAAVTAPSAVGGVT